MKRALLFFLAFFVINCGYAQVNYGSCQTVPTGSPCFFGLYSFWITNVSFGTLNFSGGTCSGDGTDDGYQDLYALDSGMVTQGNTYTFSITRSSSFFGNNGGFFSVWVDWNNDGDFADTLELLYTVTGADGPLMQSFSVTVPANAVVGEHRLRTRSDQGDPMGNPNPCGTASGYADTKDFKLIVAGNSGSPCSVTIHTPYDNGANPCLYGCNATLWAEPTGAASFTYSWSPVVSTDSFITKACAGTYSVTLTDNNGCTATDTVTISQPDSMYITAIVNSIYFHCDSVKPGCITITSVNGGAGGPYTYMWSTGQTTSSICTTTAGQYCFTLTDSRGCSMKDTCFFMSVPPPVMFTVDVTGQNPSCKGCADGSLTATPLGGVYPYSYQWSPSVSTDSVATGLTAGTYTVCVTDFNGCQACDTASLIDPCSVIIHTPYDNGAHPCIYGCAATLTAEPTGVAPFTYSWLPVASTDSVIHNACANTYSVNMTDKNGCTATDTVTIHQPDSIHAVGTVTDIHYSCDTLKAGGVTIDSTYGGSGGAYTYLWCVGTTGTKMTTTVPLSCCVAVTDSRGCTDTSCFTIMKDTTQLTLKLTGQNPTCSSCADGVITALASEGPRPYSYLWLPGAFTDSVETGLVSGTYTVCVTDSNGCTVCDTITISAPLSTSEWTDDMLFNISPNPVKDKFTVYGLRFTIASMEIYSVFGQVCEQTALVNPKSEINITSLSPGVYFIRIRTDKELWTGRFVKE